MTGEDSMLDSVHPVPLCARGHVLNMCGAPGSQETEGRLHALHNKTALAAPSPVSLDTNSGCRDLDFFGVFFIAVREFKDQGLVFPQVCLSMELLHPVSICFSEFAGEADHNIQYMFTLEMQKRSGCRAVELSWQHLWGSFMFLFLCHSEQKALHLVSASEDQSFYISVNAALRGEKIVILIFCFQELLIHFWQFATSRYDKF